MTGYSPATYRPARYSPVLGQTFDQILGINPAGGDVIRFIGHGVGAWFGIYIGTRSNMSALLRIVGWLVGTGMAITGVLDIVSLMKRATGTHPPE